MDLDVAIDFLQRLRPSGPWNLVSITPDGPVEGTVAKSVDAARAWLAQRAERENCYYQPGRAPRPTGAAGRAGKADIEAAEFAHLDIDEFEGVALATDPALKTTVLGRLQGFTEPGPPSFIIDSGGGLQALWRLDEPATTAEGKAEVERINRRLISALGGDGSTWNMDRPLRLPGTLNIPDARKRARGRETVPTRLVEATDRTYPRYAFPLAPPRPKAVEVDIVIGGPEDVEDLDALGAEHNLPDHLLELVRTGQVEGKSMPSRSEWLFSAVMQLVRHKVPNETIMGILIDDRFAISESVLEKADPDGYAERQVRSALAKVAAERASEFDDELPPDDEPARVSRYAPMRYSDLLALPLPKWLVDHWVTEGGLFSIFGAEKMFKSFIMLDLCLCIATGRDWHGIKVKQGRVKYVIGEGNARRFADRITAWRIHNKVSQAEVDANFVVVPVRVGVDTPADLKDFFRADHSSYHLVVIDTVARNMDGDESATRDMNKMVQGADRIREVHHSAVGLVHHSGKDTARGARGSSALPGAVDAEIQVTKNKAGQTVVTLRRARDSEDGVSLVLVPRTIVVSELEEDMRTSLAMHFVRVGTDADVKEGESGAPVERTAVEKVLVALAERGGVVEAKELISSTEKGLSRANVHKALARLREEKLVAGTGPIFCTEQGIERALELGAAVPEPTTDVVA